MEKFSTPSSVATIEPSQNPIFNPIACDKIASYRAAAFTWYGFGFTVMPIVPCTKKTSVKWDPWLECLSPEKINNHWTQNPNHELGFIVGDGIIVFDADSPSSIAALAEIEKAFNVTPNLISKTSKGEHHYFKRAADTHAKSDSHSTENHPERIDVKTGRALVVLPPSTGKSIAMLEAENASELTEVGQDFIDAVFRHNGRVAPLAPKVAPSPRIRLEPQSQAISRLNDLLDHIDPDCGYDDWIHTLMAIFQETDGSDDGLELADAWSSKGTKYEGHKTISDKWQSFKPDLERPVTIATLIKMAEANGFDQEKNFGAAEPQFERCEYAIVKPDTPSPEAPLKAENPLDKYSLRGKSGEIEKQAIEAVPVLGQIALRGQATVLYAAPNTGKTLITLNLLVDAIQNSRVNPSMVYYLNMDDTSSGVVEKLRIAEEYGFHMLAEGHRDFSANQFLGHIAEMVEQDQAHGVVIILDTLKKFVNLMDKAKSSSFTKVVRQFVMKGGTLVALAHTNKMPGQNGKPVYGGTSDIMDDFDCAYTLAPITPKAGSSEKVVEFENKKRRGNVVPNAAYSYSIQSGTPYTDILLSVQPVDEIQLEPMKQAEQLASDAEVINTVIACIVEGINTKMNLVDGVAKRAGVSKKSALQIIDKYTGDDPAKYMWTYSVHARGAKVYALLDRTPPNQGPDATGT